MTWSAANSTCRSMGGNLVVPRNGNENDAICQIARQNRLKSPWIGLVRHEDKELYTVCGSKPTYTSWARGKPDNKGGHENCGQFWKNAGQWNDESCTRQLHFICEYPSCASENHDCPIGWIRLVSSCYYFSTNETNWSTANSTCRSLGGDLVVPRNDEENSAIIKTADQNGLNHPWIGLVRDENNTFYTVSGSKPTYTPWSKGRPNNKGGDEKCGQFLDSAGLWNDIPCNRQFNFICEYRNFSASTRPSSSVTTTSILSRDVTTTNSPSRSVTIGNGPVWNVTTSERPSRNGSCPSEVIGAFFWPETNVGSLATVACPHDAKARATRECQYKDETFHEISWRPVDAKACQFKSQQMFNLLEKPVNTSNVIEVGQQIRKLSFPGEELTFDDVVNLAHVLENIVAVSVKSDEVAEDVFNTVDNILDAPVEIVEMSQQQKNSSVRIVQSLNRLLELLNITETRTFQRTLKNFAIDLSVVDPSSFSGVTFSGIINENMSSLKSELVVKKLSGNKTVSEPKATTIRLPRTLFTSIADGNASQSQTVVFALYKETKFFRLLSSQPTNLSQRLNTYVIAGSVKALSVSNLTNPVVLTYPNLKPGNKSGAFCGFWSVAEASWSNEGCTFQGVQKDGRIVCHCDHLTNFAMLMDIYPDVITPHERSLNLISYVGCAVSLVGLALTIITVSLFKDLRSKVPNQILLNFCIALSLTLAVFIAAGERSKTSSLASCRAVAIALHYFVLVVFMWMAMEALNMYLEFVKILPTSLPQFFPKCCIVAWGFPAVIVSITVGVTLDDYGGPRYCRLHGIPFLVSFLAPAVLILVGNSVAFVVIFYSLLTSGRKITSSQKITGFQRARQGAAILVLFGLTWLFGVLAIKDAKIVFQYLFCVFNSLQGLLVFVFYCVLSSRIRKKFKLFREKKGVNGSGKRNTVNLNMEVKNTKTKECTSKKTGQIANIESAFIANTLSKTPKEVLCFPNSLFQPAPTMQLRENVKIIKPKGDRS